MPPEKLTRSLFETLRTTESRLLARAEDLMTVEQFLRSSASQDERMVVVCEGPVRSLRDIEVSVDEAAVRTVQVNLRERVKTCDEMAAIQRRVIAELEHLARAWRRHEHRELTDTQPIDPP